MVGAPCKNVAMIDLVVSKLNDFEFLVVYAWKSHSGPKNSVLGISWTHKHDLSSMIPQKAHLVVKLCIFSHKFLRSTFVICRWDERIWLCVCVWGKNSNFPYFPRKIGWAHFAWILHNHSTLSRNHIFWAAFKYLLSHFTFTGGRIFRFSIYCDHGWLLSQHIYA